MTTNSTNRILLATTLIFSSLAIASDDPVHERHELMEGVRDAAKPVGQMLRGNTEFDNEVFMQSMQVFDAAAATFGTLFPEGSQSEESEATPAVWDDREGFDAALKEWQVATTAAMDANPQTLEEARPVAGPVFQTCKGCHDDYRLEKED